MLGEFFLGQINRYRGSYQSCPKGGLPNGKLFDKHPTLVFLGWLKHIIRDGHVHSSRQASDLQATPLLPWTSVRPAQTRDEERAEDPLRTSLRSAPRSTSSATRCRSARDARVQAPEEPLVKEHERTTLIPVNSSQAPRGTS